MNNAAWRIMCRSRDNIVFGTWAAPAYNAGHCWRIYSSRPPASPTQRAAGRSASGNVTILISTQGTGQWGTAKPCITCKFIWVRVVIDILTRLR